MKLLRAFLILLFAGFSLPATARPTVALVLEGGGALGLAHVGVIKVLEEAGVPVDIVVGTSMGSIIGGFYALGYDANELNRIALRTPWQDLFHEEAPVSERSYREKDRRSKYLGEVDFDWKGLKVSGGLLSGRRIVSYFDQMALEASAVSDFDQFPRRFRAVAADVMTGETVVLSHGRLADALRASMSIPGLFSPYQVEGRYLVDGGIVSNLPVETARKLGADLIIAVHLTTDLSYKAEDFERNPVSALGRTLDILVDANVQRQLTQADLVLTVPLGTLTTTDFAKAAEFVQRGEEAARARLPDLKNFMGTQLPAGSKTVRHPPAPKITELWIRSGDPVQEAEIRALFAPILGRPARTESLFPLYLDLENHFDFESVRFTTQHVNSETILTIETRPKPPRSHSLELGFGIQSTFSSSVSNQTVLAPAAVFRSLIFPGSELTVEPRLLDNPGLKVNYRQPLTRLLFAEGFYQYQQSTSTYQVVSQVSYQYQSTYNLAGADLGLAPGPGTEITAGLTHVWLLSANFENTSSEVNRLDLTAFTTAFHWVQTDHPVLPTQGFDLNIQYISSVPALNAGRYFQVLEASGSMNMPLLPKLTGSLLGRAGSDFTWNDSDPQAAPSYLKSMLILDRRMFPGPLYLKDQIGSHVAALGLEFKRQWAAATGAFGFPLFSLAQVSVGNVFSQASDIRVTADKLLVCGALGLGIRVNDGCALVLRGGTLRKSDGQFYPYLSLDLGSTNL